MKKLFKSTSGLTNLLFVLLMVLLAAGVVLLNMVARSLSDKYPLSADLTANAAYRIGEDTKAILGNLTTDVDIYSLATENQFSGNSNTAQLRRILEEYPKYSDRVHLHYVDYAADPTFAASYPDLELRSGDTLVVSTFGIKQLPLANMFTYNADAAGNLSVNACRGEEALTSAIVGVLTDDTVQVGILVGSGAAGDTATFGAVLTNNNYDVTQVNMVTDDLTGYDILVLAAPAEDLSEDVLAKLDAFLYNDGALGRTLLYTAAVNQPEMPHVDAFLREWGIAVGDGAVFETSADRTYSYQPYYPYTDYTDPTYSAGLKDASNPFLAPMARPLSAVFDFRDNRTVTELLSFGASAGIRPSDAPDTFAASDAEQWGPFPALLMSTRQIGNSGEKSCVLVSASTAAFGATAMGNTSFSNGSYAVNLFNTLTDRGDAVAIEAKSLAGSALTLSTAAASRLGLILCILLPVAILGTGITVFLRRRYK